MKMSQEEYDNYVEEDAGFCAKCDAVSLNLHSCDSCGNTRIIKLEEAFELEDVEISEDEDEDSDEDYDGPNFL